MVSIVMDLLFGGYETTSKLLSLIVYFLEGAPNALESLKVLSSFEQQYIYVLKLSLIWLMYIQWQYKNKNYLQRHLFILYQIVLEIVVGSNTDS